MIRQGEFYRWRAGAGAAYVRVLVLSVTEVNEVSAPVVAPIARTGTASLYLPALAETDPVSGVVALARLGVVDPAELDGPDGMVSGPTFDRISSGLRGLFGL